jgi:hypothetical protein
MIDFEVMLSIAETQEMPALLQEEENSAGKHVRVVNPSLRCYGCSKCLCKLCIGMHLRISCFFLLFLCIP